MDFPVQVHVASQRFADGLEPQYITEAFWRNRGREEEAEAPSHESNSPQTAHTPQDVVGLQAERAPFVGRVS